MLQPPLKRMPFTYFAIELIFIFSLVLLFPIFQIFHFHGLPLASISLGTPKAWHVAPNSILELLFKEKSKRIFLNYYGEQFSVETSSKTFAELVVLLPPDIKIEREHFDQLKSLPIFDKMEIAIPPGLYAAGIASWYGDYFQGRPTASTEPYNMYELTAASKTLPLGTYVKVTNVKNRKSVIVRINDRGPYVGERIIDLSWEGARQLGFLSDGLAMVVIEIVK